jgi:hypothetical protein
MAKDKEAREMIHFQWHGTQCIAIASHTLPIETQVHHPLKFVRLDQDVLPFSRDAPPAVTVSEFIVLIFLTEAIIGGNNQQVPPVRTMNCGNTKVDSAHLTNISFATASRFSFPKRCSPSWSANLIAVPGP